LGYSVYRVHETEKRQFCWAHLLRNFRGLEEAGGKARSLGVAGQNIVKAIFREWYRVRDGTLRRASLRRRLGPIRARLERLLQRHLNNPVPAARKIAKDLLKHCPALWTFASVEGIEPTNNAAERALRKAVLWRKNSFGSASREGSLFVERMLTVCESIRAQGRSILDFLVETISATGLRLPTPSLVPAIPGSCKAHQSESNSLIRDRTASSNSRALALGADSRLDDTRRIVCAARARCSRSRSTSAQSRGTKSLEAAINAVLDSSKSDTARHGY
jgi:hypothetical protein